MRPFHRLLVYFLLFASCLAAAPATPANPAASPQALKILAFIASLEGRHGRHILTGQFLGYATQDSRNLPDKIHAETGCWPALIGVDYADLNRDTLDTRLPNRTALAYWRDGGLVTISTHLYDPTAKSGYGLRDKNVTLDALLTPGTKVNRRWRHELDLIADGLDQLQKDGVVVLWRPFHEMNGGWFWWGHKDPASFVRLWRDMFDYFTKTRHLDNLLWVYAPNHGQDTTAYYPGDAYVDIVGLDSYTNHVDPLHVPGYAVESKLPKPWGFTEFGPTGSTGGQPSGNFDYREFAYGMTAYFQRTTFFLCWDANWSPANNRFAREFYRSPEMLNREDLPAGLAGSTAKP